MDKRSKHKGYWLLLFLALFGLSIGVFDNYRDLWMSANEISTISISHVKSVASVVTVLVLFFFTIKVPTEKLKKGMDIVLVLKMAIEVLLILLNGSSNVFFIKFLMFFDIAFTQLILSSIYPLMMNFEKNDEIYTKKSFVESFSDKVGFLIVSIVVGKTIFGHAIDFNTCLIFALVFTFLSFVVLITISIDKKGSSKSLNVKQAVGYFRENKVYLSFLGFNLLGSIVWGTILGMPMLTLTKNLNIDSQMASFLILGLGVVSNVMSMVILKFMRFKNDQINIIFKFGIRTILYVATFVTGNPILLLATIIYMLFTNMTHNFIFSSFFVNRVDENYSMTITTLKYCTSLLGDAIGIFICGLVFDSSINMMALPAAILGVIHYILAIVLVEKKKKMISPN